MKSEQFQDDLRNNNFLKKQLSNKIRIVFIVNFPMKRELVSLSPFVS